MTCIKTGARVYFADYNVTLSADIYAVEGVVVVRTCSWRDEAFPRGDEGATHNLYAPPGGVDQFWRPDIGVFVVPQRCITEFK